MPAGYVGMRRNRPALLQIKRPVKHQACRITETIPLNTVATPCAHYFRSGYIPYSFSEVEIIPKKLKFIIA